MHIALAETDASIARCFPIMAQLRPHLVEKEFVARVRQMQAEKFHLAYVEEAGPSAEGSAKVGAICAVAGYRYLDKLFSGKNLYVDDLVTDAAQRSKGHGKALLSWLIAEARAHDCRNFELDSGVQRFDAHRFYLRERMHISSYHFSLKLTA